MTWILRPLAECFWEKVDRDGPMHPTLRTACWLWTGTHLRNGYARLHYARRQLLAHRVAWELTHGEIPTIEGTDDRGTCVCHRCDNPSCVNPDHLFLGTHVDNMADRDAKGRQTRGVRVPPTHCKHGHAFEGDNLRVKNGGRQCRACNRIRSLASYHRRVSGPSASPLTSPSPR